MKYFIYSIIGVVTALVIVGFFIVGSPKEERMRQFDERRVNDLSSLQYEVVSYWQSKGSLPAKLDMLGDSLQGFPSYADPESDAPYDYAIKGKLTFELCATFGLASDTAVSTIPEPTKPMRVGVNDPYHDSWKHSAGHFCFERTIDPDRYPPIKPIK